MKTTLFILSFAAIFSMKLCSPEPSNDCDQLLKNWTDIATNFGQNVNSSNCRAYWDAFKKYYEGGCPGTEYYTEFWEEYTEEYLTNPDEWCEYYDLYN